MPLLNMKQTHKHKGSIIKTVKIIRDKLNFPTFFISKAILERKKRKKKVPLAETTDRYCQFKKQP